MELFMDKIESPLGEMLLVTDDQGTDQSVSIGFKLTLANRLQMISRGLRLIAAAFRIRQ
jgi:hypothetical protein